MLKRWLVWFMRCGHSRGFGIQSPWAYRFVRYVINEHYPYYAYSELATSLKVDYRLPRLYFRLANYMQSSDWYSYFSQAEEYENYIHYGCKKCDVVAVCDVERLPKKFDIVSVGLREDYVHICERLISCAHSGTLIIVEGIHQRKAALAYWRKIIKDQRVRISFDLYVCGLLFFDPKQHKRHYIINF